LEGIFISTFELKTQCSRNQFLHVLVDIAILLKCFSLQDFQKQFWQGGGIGFLIEKQNSHMIEIQLYYPLLHKITLSQGSMKKLSWHNFDLHLCNAYFIFI